MLGGRVSGTVCGGPSQAHPEGRIDRDGRRKKSTRKAGGKTTRGGGENDWRLGRTTLKDKGTHTHTQPPASLCSGSARCWMGDRAPVTSCTPGMGLRLALRSASTRGDRTASTASRRRHCLDRGRWEQSCEAMVAAHVSNHDAGWLAATVDGLWAAWRQPCSPPQAAGHRGPQHLGVRLLLMLQWYTNPMARSARSCALGRRRWTQGEGEGEGRRRLPARQPGERTRSGEASRAAARPCLLSVPEARGTCRLHAFAGAIGGIRADLAESKTLGRLGTVACVRSTANGRDSGGRRAIDSEQAGPLVDLSHHRSPRRPSLPATRVFQMGCRVRHDGQFKA
jgi:hypothetical protein